MRLTGALAAPRALAKLRLLGPVKLQSPDRGPTRYRRSLIARSGSAADAVVDSVDDRSRLATVLHERAAHSARNPGLGI